MRRTTALTVVASIVLMVPAIAFATTVAITRGQLPPDSHYTAEQCTNPDCHAAPTVGAAIPDGHYDYVCVDCHGDGTTDPPTTEPDLGPFSITGSIADISFENASEGWAGQWGRDWDSASDAPTRPRASLNASSEGSDGSGGVRSWITVETTDGASQDIFIYDDAQAVETTVLSFNGEPIDRAKFCQLVAGNNYYNDFAASIGAKPILYTADVVYYTRTLGAGGDVRARCEDHDPLEPYAYAASIALSDSAPLPQAFSGTLVRYTVKVRALQATAVVKNRRGKVLSFTTHKTRTAYRVNGRKVSRAAFVKAAKRARVRNATVTWSSYRKSGVAKRWASQLSLTTRRK
jgi:hypothetical protein